MNSQTQSPLEISPPMLAGLALVVLLGLIGFRRNQNREPSPAPINLEVTRVANESVSFDHLGIRVEPSHGWTHLAVSGVPNQMPTFVNESQHLIVRIHPFIFKTWPPAMDELTDKGIAPNAGESSDRSESIAETKVETVQYSNVKIEWIGVERDRSRGNSYRVGRIPLDRGSLLITFAIHSGKNGLPDSIESFCNSIAPIAETR